MSNSPWLTPGAKPSPYHAVVGVVPGPPVVGQSMIVGPPRNSAGTASLVTGIVVLAGTAIPYANSLAFLTFLLPLILGIVGVRHRGAPRKAAIAGIVCACASVVSAIVLIVVYNAVFSGS
jgi:hypothetical protein